MLGKELVRLPIIEAKHFTNLPVRKAAGSISFNGRMLQDSTTYVFGGFPKRTGDTFR